MRRSCTWFIELAPVENTLFDSVTSRSAAAILCRASAPSSVVACEVMLPAQWYKAAGSRPWPTYLGKSMPLNSG